MNVADEDEFSPDKLRSSVERYEEPQYWRSETY